MIIGRRLLRTVLVLVLALDILLFAGAGVALSGSRGLPFEVQVGTTDCPWVAGNTGACVDAIGGVALDDTSLIREFAYLSLEDLNRWAEDQALLHQRLRHPTVEVMLDGQPVQLATQPAAWRLGPIFGGGFASLVLVGLGAFVLLRRPRLPEARSLFWMCQGIVLALVPTLVNSLRAVAFSPDAAWLLYGVNMVGLVLGSSAALRLVGVYPRDILGRHTRRLTLHTPLLVGAASLIAEATGVFGAALGYTALAMTLTVALFVVGQRSALAHQQRMQSRWLLWGLAIPVTAFVLIRTPYVLGLAQGDPDESILFLLSVTVPLGAAVGITRHGMMGVEVVVRRTIVGAMAATVVVLGYSLVLSLIAGDLTRSIYAQSVFTTALVLTVLLVPVQPRLERTVHRVFFRNRFGYRRVLEMVAQELTTSATSSQAVDLVLDRIARSMGLRAGFVSLDEGTQTWSFGDVRSPHEDAFWAWIRSASKPHLAGDGEPLDTWLAEHDLVMLLPLRTPEGFMGVMGLSGLPSKALFTADDLSLLRSVSAALALALARTLAFEKMARLNDELEGRIETRTQELAQTRLRLYQWEKMASLSVLSAGISHELNTPLSVIMSTAEELCSRLEEGSDDAELANLCLTAAQRGAAIVADMSRFSSSESQDRQQVDIHLGLDTTLRLLKAKLARRNIQVVQQRSSDPLMVRGTPGPLYQTFVNLMLNAAQAVDEGGTITIETRSINGAAQIVISDDGPGVSPEFHDRIFEPFFTTREAGRGTGLGLSLCFTFIEEQDGTIREVGTPGEGARFEIVLPLESSHVD